MILMYNNYNRIGENMKNDLSIDFFSKFYVEKKLREILCNDYIEKNELLALIIIKYFNLKRFQKKYVLNNRFYDENSYSKKKIFEEEIIFLTLMAQYQPLEFYFTEQIQIYQELLLEKYEKQQKIVDRQFYLKTCIEKNPDISIDESLILIFRRNNNIQFDITIKSLENKKLRENIIDSMLEKHRELIIYIAEKFSLKYVEDLYLTKNSFNYSSSYLRKKIKYEEIFLCKKLIQYSIWIIKMQRYNKLKKSTEKIRINNNIVNGFQDKNIEFEKMLFDLLVFGTFNFEI